MKLEQMPECISVRVCIPVWLGFQLLLVSIASCFSAPQAVLDELYPSQNPSQLRRFSTSSRHPPSV